MDPPNRGGSLIKPLGVDQIDFAGFTDAHIFHQGTECLGIYRGPQNPFFITFPAEYGNDEMRFLPETPVDRDRFSTAHFRDGGQKCL